MAGEGPALIARIDAAERATLLGRQRAAELERAKKGLPARSKCPPWQCPSSAPAPPQGAPGGSGQLCTPRKRPTHWGAQPMPRVPELAAFKAADFTAFDPSGLQLDLVKLSAANTRQQHICRELQGAMKALGGGGGEGSAEEEEEAARRVELASKFDGTIGDIAPQP